MSDSGCLRSLVKRYYRINHVSFADETRIEGNTLYLASNLRTEALDCSDQRIVLDMEIKLVSPGEYGSYTDTILDVQPLAVKGKDSRLGGGNHAFALRGCAGALREG